MGDLTFTITSPSTNFAIGSGTATPFTTRIAGNQIAISDVENLNVDLVSPVFSFGFEFVEPENDPNVNGPFVDSTFEVSLFNSAVFVDSFSFSRPNDVAAFVGVWGDMSFDRVEIREIVGGIGNEFFGQFYSGTASVSVPEPSTLFLLGTGLVGLAAYRRKRRA